MNRRQTTAACVAALLFAASAGALADELGQPKVLRAHAIVTGPGIHGIVTFRQRQACPDCKAPALGTTPSTDPAFRNFPEPPVDVVARIDGTQGSSLSPGAHGMHIHEVASCANTAAAFGGAGSHFDPGPASSNVPVDANHPFHMGDLPNLIVNDRGKGFMRTTTNRITLTPGPLSVFDADGSAVVVHVGPDTGQPGVTGGAGGARIACGVVVGTPPGDIDEDED
jgi:Cu-Zn family superoxide dismutase